MELKCFFNWTEPHYIIYGIDWNQGEGVQLVPIMWIAGMKHGGTSQLSESVVATHLFFNNNQVRTYCLLSLASHQFMSMPQKTL